MSLPRRCIFVLGLALLGLAAAPRVFAAGAEPGILLLGINQGERPQLSLHQAVLERLRHMGEAAVPLQPGSAAADWLCRRTRCLTTLAQRHHVQRLMGGDILPNDRTYLIKLWGYDVRSGDLRTEQGSCENCDEAALADAVAAVAGRLLDRPGAVAPMETLAPPLKSAPAPVAGVEMAPATTAAAQEINRPWNQRHRQAWAGALGGLAVLTLATAINLNVHDGQIYGPCTDAVNNPRTCAYDFSWAAPTGYAISAAALAGVALVLTVPLAKSGPAAPKEDR